MKTRQATILKTILLTLLAGLSACFPSNKPLPTPRPIHPTSTPFQTFTTSPTTAPPTATSTSTPLACLTAPGRVDSGVLDTTKPPQEFFIYLPPCYDEMTDKRYPVLYLLHGQTYTADQWIRLGAATTLDNLVRSGESVPFIIVFPDDRFWNLAAGPGFGERLVDHLVPYIDSVYRTLPDRNHRAIGGMSRGANWAFKLGFNRWDLFSIIGLHSLAAAQKDIAHLDEWIEAIPPSARPNIFMDSGNDDQGLVSTEFVEEQFTKYEFPHEWHLYNGAHTEEYWSAHVEEYIRWYAEQWNNVP